MESKAEKVNRLVMEVSGLKLQKKIFRVLAKVYGSIELRKMDKDFLCVYSYVASMFIKISKNKYNEDKMMIAELIEAISEYENEKKTDKRQEKPIITFKICQN